MEAAHGMYLSKLIDDEWGLFWIEDLRGWSSSTLLQMSWIDAIRSAHIYAMSCRILVCTELMLLHANRAHSNVSNEALIDARL